MPLSLRTLIASIIFTSTPIYALQQFTFPSDYLASLNIGYSDSIHHPYRSFQISEYDTDALHGFNQNHFTSFNASIKGIFNIAENNYLHLIAIGPSVYYQKNQYKGDVWELELPQFNNYTYKFVSESVPILLEGDMYFQPLFKHLELFVTLGMGLAVNHLEYTDTPGDNIPANSSLKLNKQNINFAADIGAGVAYTFNSHWSASLRYNYMYLGKPNTGTSDIANIQQPLRILLTSNNIYFGIQFAS